MSWDVFISHASEDKPFVRKLARGLQDAGLRVWFDEFALEAGDSLRRSIDRGLRESRYGVVVLSPNFFRKEWPQRELDGFTARDDGRAKVIIPVWYKISAEEVQSYSPLLADKLSVYYSGSSKGVVAKLLRAIRKDAQGGGDWTPEFITVAQLSLAVLPVNPEFGRALCIGRFPVSNAEYAAFIKSSDHRPPIGEAFVDGGWHGPFDPWSSKEFSEPDKPVVCVDLWDALAFTTRATSPEATVFLPTAELWDFVAAEGQPTSSIRSVLESLDRTKLCGRGLTPAALDATGDRDNSFGVSDMFGNVWEWCGGFEERQDYGNVAILAAPRLRVTEAELRGGGFLDDLDVVYPALRSGLLEDGTRTKHSDLGFRVCAAVELKELDAGLVELLKTKRSLPRRIWEVARHPTDWYRKVRYLESRFRLDGDEA